MGNIEREYEEACERIRATNDALLSDFDHWLTTKGLSDKTVREHAQNIELYVNHYLLYEDAIEAAEGAHHVSMFLGYWFIRKALWASEASIRSNAASLKKFYAFMLERGLISYEDLVGLRETINECLPDWTATMSRYDDPSITDPEDIWGL